MLAGNCAEQEENVGLLLVHERHRAQESGCGGCQHLLSHSFKTFTLQFSSLDALGKFVFAGL